MDGVPGPRRAGLPALRLRAADRGQRVRRAGRRPVLLGRHHLGHPPQQAGRGLGLVPVRARAVHVRDGRRVHVHLPARVRCGRALPVVGRRHLPVALPGAVRRHLHPRPAAKPVRRVGVADRLADPDDRPRPDLVAGADLAGDPRRQPDAAGPDRLDRLPHGRHPAAGRRAAPGGRQRQAPARLLPAVRQHHDAARDRLHLRRDAEQRHLQRPGAARHRLDLLLPALGHLGPAPVDAHSRGAGAGEGDEPVLAAAGRAHGRLADRSRPAGAARRPGCRRRRAGHDRRLDRPVPAGRGAHGGAGRAAGAVGGTRTRAARGGHGPGRRGRPGRHRRGRAVGRRARWPVPATRRGCAC